MANTLKFGNGQWAVKESSALAYNDENGNFKPLPFTFDRSTSATRVNKQGLIEVVPNNEPRIDFLNDSKGALLLEPLRNNYIPYSTLDFNGGSKPEGWSIGFGTGTYSYEQLTYKGQKAVKQTQITTGRSYLDTGSISILANTEHTLKIQFILDECVADANDDIVSFLAFGVNTNYKFSDIDANGVLEVQYNPLSDNVGNLRIGLGCVQNEDGGKSLAWAIPQLEQGSYATSYIPTQGSIGTRDEEDIALTLPDDASFNSSNGFSLYGEFLTNGGSGTSVSFIQFNGNVGYVGFGSNGLTWRSRINNGTLNELHTSSASIFQNGKLATSFNNSGFSMYANGNSFASGNTDMSTITSIDTIDFRDNTEEFGSMRIKELKLYNTRLTNSELQQLTS